MMASVASLGSPETAIRRYFQRRERRERWGIAAHVVEVLGGLLDQELEGARMKKTEEEQSRQGVSISSMKSATISAPQKQ